MDVNIKLQGRTTGPPFSADWIPFIKSSFLPKSEPRERFSACHAFLEDIFRKDLELWFD